MSKWKRSHDFAGWDFVRFRFVFKYFGFQEELSSLLSKVKDVISENENLHERQKSNLIKSVFNHFETETETENEVDPTQKVPAEVFASVANTL